ncbi:MAG: peptidylprolyl isomerase [Bacteroidales bacterium]|jgi:cyclophilin family peptidyl-prolyl cis-trans isomerase|nr:peptidylprolyl isomerase [Bacteroidales bacterium]
MNIAFRKLLLILFVVLTTACDAPGGDHDTYVLISTSMGDIRVKLYNGTPVHRDNFINLVNQGIYDGISFHRVINEFMIQAGDPSTRSGLSKKQLDTLQNYTLPAEIRPEYFHKKGALAAARQGNEVNPEMRSSGTQFYIVQGTLATESQLVAAQERINNNLRQAMFIRQIRSIADSARVSGTPMSESEIQEQASLKMFEYLSSDQGYRITDAQKEVYKTTGGVPRLDGTYTVFGEVVEGLEVVDKIAAVGTDQSDKPLTDVRILSMKISE